MDEFSVDINVGVQQPPVPETVQPVVQTYSVEQAQIPTEQPAEQPEVPAEQPAKQGEAVTTEQDAIQSMLNVETMREMLEPLRSLCNTPFAVAEAHHRYDNKPPIGSLLMGLTNEVAEAHDAFACKRMSSVRDLDLLETLLKEGKTDLFAKYFKTFVKNTFEDELADVILYALSIAGYYNIDIARQLMLKNAYNVVRSEHSQINDNIAKND